MDKRYEFHQVTVVLFNPMGQMRATLRDALLALGFRQILDFSELDAARAAIIETMPDLVLLDLDRHRDSVCALVRDIRLGQVGSDPFVVTIALTWHPLEAAINNTMEAGVDDIVTLPVSVKLVSERLHALIDRRKEFVVTSSYIGPDRRTRARSAEKRDLLGTIPVPNNLRFKVSGDPAAAASPEAIDAAQGRISSHRLNRYAERIAWLVDQIKLSRSNNTDSPAATKARNDEIGLLIVDLDYELVAQGYDGLTPICESMENVLAAIRARPTNAHYDLLRLHALAVTATLLEQDGAADMVMNALNEAAARLDMEKTA